MVGKNSNIMGWEVYLRPLCYLQFFLILLKGRMDFIFKSKEEVTRIGEGRYIGDTNFCSSNTGHLGLIQGKERSLLPLFG